MKLVTCALMVCLPVALLAQEPNPTQNLPKQEQTNPTSGPVPIYKVQVVARAIDAVSYQNRSGWTKVNFQGTSLAPQSKGSANVRSQLGHLEIKVDIKGLPSARNFGPLYLTYVLWAITPDGRPSNLGEIVVNSDGNYSGQMTTGLQSFGLIVTAEPYFNVHQPSDVVVMENIIRSDTKGRWQTINAHYQLLPRGTYTYHVPEEQLKPVDLNSDKKSPLQLYEAQNAIQIAEYAKADHYATETFNQAQQLFQQAQDYRAKKEWNSVIMVSREAVQKAEDARIISLRNQQQEELANERAEAAARQAAANQRAAEEAERARQAQQQAELEAKQRAEADAARKQADAARAQADAEAAKAQQSAEEADRLRKQAEQQKEQLRQQLLQQFNSVLPTRETSRGLVVNMQDVLFATGKYDLTTPAQLALARISGILASHNGLSLEVEGYTDSTGTLELNQKLSENRANTVRAFLINQGLNPANVTAQGYGESYPVASNDTAAGRKMNRRVELIVSGEVIGVKIGVPPSQENSVPPPPPPAGTAPPSHQ